MNDTIKKIQPVVATSLSLSAHSLSNSSINSRCRCVTSLQTERFLRLPSILYERREESPKLKIKVVIWRRNIRWNSDIEVDILIPERQGIPHLYSCKHRNIKSVIYYTNTNLEKILYLLSTSTHHFYQLQRQTDCSTNLIIYKKGSTITTITNLCPEGQPSLLVGYLVEPEHRVS